MLLYARSFDIHPRANAQTNQRHLAFERQSINVYTPWEKRGETFAPQFDPRYASHNYSAEMQTSQCETQLVIVIVLGHILGLHR